MAAAAGARAVAYVRVVRRGRRRRARKSAGLDAAAIWRTDEVTPLGRHHNDPGPGRETWAGGTEFFTFFTQAIPPGTADQAVRDAEAGEAERTRDLTGQGHLERLWVLPGAGRALGLWRADSSEQLQAILESLPLYAWLTVQTTALSPHPSDPGNT